MQFILHTLFGNLVVRVDVVCDPNWKYRYFANLFFPKDYVIKCRGGFKLLTIPTHCVIFLYMFVRAWHHYIIVWQDSTCNFKGWIIFEKCSVTFTASRFLCSETVMRISSRLWMFTAANYTPDLLFGAIDMLSIAKI